jgi:glycosyltransferase involved in cell wall biosynthesis
MKILFNCGLPFFLAHGGHAIQIQQTMAALQGIGVEVEPLRWWDEAQTGDVIHYFFGRMIPEQIRFAHQKKIRVVMSELLTGQGSRSPGRLRFQRLLSRAICRLAPPSFSAAFKWDSYRLADALVALTAWEKHLMEYLFEADPARTFVVPNGVEEIFFHSPPVERGPWLICTAVITERKRVLELAAAAVRAQTPVWIIGRAYAENDAYAQKFLQLARAHPQWIRFEGAVTDRGELAKIYRAARGFVLLSTKESLSLSALEAAAAGCPLLLSDLPWARTTFSGGVQFCPVTGSAAVTAGALRRFYDAAPQLPAPPQPATWPDVARQLKVIYEQVLAGRS